MKRQLRPTQNGTLPIAMTLLVVLGWYFVFQQSESLTQTTTTTYQQTQLEIVRAMARSVESYVEEQVALSGRQDITQIEQEMFQRFIAPVHLVDSGDAWIYAPEYVVFDPSSDFPATYRGKSMAEIFAIQRELGASNYEAMTEAVMNAREGVGWYIWLPDKGKEIAAWTPVTVGDYVWTIGLSTPLPEILRSTGATAQIRNSIILMAIASLIALGLVGAWMRSTAKRGQAEQALREAITALEQNKVDLEEQVAARTAELVNTNTKLQAEIRKHRRTETALLEAKNTAESASRAKSTFLANMSHELRTPLTSILGYNELLQREARRNGYTDILADTHQIANAGNHLLTLISDLLDISKIEAGKMQLDLDQFDLRDLIDDIVATIRPLIDQNDNTLQVIYPDDIGAIYADPTKVRQILLNLLSNAAKFTEQGNITLYVQCADEDVHDLRIVDACHITNATTTSHKTLMFEVRDTGIGMTSEQTHHIFEAFSQIASGNQRRHRGTGLGLAISRRFCEMMGGRITVTSAPGEGSTFTFTLPLQVTEQFVSIRDSV